MDIWAILLLLLCANKAKKSRTFLCSFSPCFLCISSVVVFFFKHCWAMWTAIRNQVPRWICDAFSHISMDIYEHRNCIETQCLWEMYGVYSVIRMHFVSFIWFLFVRSSVCRQPSRIDAHPNGMQYVYFLCCSLFFWNIDEGREQIPTKFDAIRKKAPKRKKQLKKNDDFV